MRCIDALAPASLAEAAAQLHQEMPSEAEVKVIEYLKAVLSRTLKSLLHGMTAVELDNLNTQLDEAAVELASLKTQLHEVIAGEEEAARRKML